MADVAVVWRRYGCVCAPIRTHYVSHTYPADSSRFFIFMNWTSGANVQSKVQYMRTGCMVLSCGKLAFVYGAFGKLNIHQLWRDWFFSWPKAYQDHKSLFISIFVANLVELSGAYCELGRATGSSLLCDAERYKLKMNDLRLLMIQIEYFHKFSSNLNELLWKIRGSKFLHHSTLMWHKKWQQCCCNPQLAKSIEIKFSSLIPAWYETLGEYDDYQWLYIIQLYKISERWNANMFAIASRLNYAVGRGRDFKCVVYRLLYSLCLYHLR